MGWPILFGGPIVHNEPESISASEKYFINSLENFEKLWKTRMFQKSGKNFEKYEKGEKVLEILKEKEFWNFKNDL